MTCSHCVGAGKVFGEKRARRELSRLRRKGPAKSTRLLIDALEAQGVTDARVIDIGAGVGAVHLELLKIGAKEAVHVDASPAYQRVSREEAERRSVQDRVAYVEGDFLDVADDLGAAEAVCLDRVICCYPHMDRLVARSASSASAHYGLVFPVDRFWVRAMIRAANLGLAVLRNPFRTFVHPESAVKSAVEEAGFSMIFEGRAGMWKILVFSRPPVSQSRSSARSSV